MTAPTATPITEDRSAGKILSALVGVATLLILLQGLWAGLFLDRTGGGRQPWLNIHSGLGELTALLGIAALVLALVRLRHRRDVVVGTAVLAALLVLAVGAGMAGRGGLWIHLPLALASMAVAVWLPTRLR